MHDIYDLSDRIKNLIALEGLSLSPAGMVLVNMQTHFLKKLYDFSDTTLMTDDQKNQLLKILADGEAVPRDIMKVLTPNPEMEEDEEYGLEVDDE